MNMKKLSIFITILILATWGVMSFVNPSHQHEKTAHETEHNHGKELVDTGYEEHEGHGSHEEREEEDDHEEHAKHSEHNEHEEEKSVHLSKEEQEEFGVRVGPAQPGTLRVEATFPTEIHVNSDRMAHVVPRVSGIVRAVRASLGDRVETGDVMAVLESRELAEAKAGYLAALERVSLAEANAEREGALWKKSVTSEKSYLEAKQALAEERIALRSSRHQLHALGFSDEYLNKLKDHDNGDTDISFTRYEITAPFSGMVIEKHLVLGEAIESQTEAFVVADLSTVWANLTAYQKDLSKIQTGQSATISTDFGAEPFTGKISYISPIVEEESRTAIVRVVIQNDSNLWRPGLFATANVELKSFEVPIRIPKTAIQNIDNVPVVFVFDGDEFSPHPIRLGRTDSTHVEVLSGLEQGENYVISGGHVLKFELGKGSFGDGHGH